MGLGGTGATSLRLATHAQTPAAFERRYMRAGRVTPRSQVAELLVRRGLPPRCLAAFGVMPGSATGRSRSFGTGPTGAQ